MFDKVYYFSCLLNSGRTSSEYDACVVRFADNTVFISPDTKTILYVASYDTHKKVSISNAALEEYQRRATSLIRDRENTPNPDSYYLVSYQDAKEYPVYKGTPYNVAPAYICKAVVPAAKAKSIKNYVFNDDGELEIDFPHYWPEPVGEYSNSI